MKDVADLIVKVAGIFALFTLIHYAVSRPSVKNDFGAKEPRTLPPYCADHVAMAGPDPTKNDVTIASPSTAVTTSTLKEEDRPIFRQGFIDVDALSSSYNYAVPHAVNQAVVRYNVIETKDLACHFDSTSTLLMPKGSIYPGTRTNAPIDLCDERPGADVLGISPPRPLIEQVYDGQQGRSRFNCDVPSSKVGDGFSYERILLDEFFVATKDLVDSAEMRDQVAEIHKALAQMHKSRYERAEGTVWNEGSARAKDVELRVPTDFTIVREQDRKFALNPGEERRNVVLESPRGPINTRLLTQPAFVTWTADKDYIDFGWLRIGLLLAGAILAGLIFNDFFTYREEPSARSR